MEERKALRKYINNSSIIMLVLGTLMIPFGIMLLTTEVAIMCLLFFGAGAIMIWLFFSTEKSINQHLNDLESTGVMPQVLLDFKQGEQHFNGKLRIGQYYLIGKGSGQVLPYQEIVQIYQYVHKTNGAEDSRAIRVKNKKGIEITLCSIPIKNKGIVELQDVIMKIAIRAPGIKIGYN